jgi:protein O-GlcNAc transferase
VKWLGGLFSAAKAPARPESARQQVELGLQHHGAGRLREAEAHYREALAQDPPNVDALHFLGVVALQRGDPAQAVELISQALARNSANPAACNNLAIALAAQGRKREAVSAWLEALALQPDYADARRNLREHLVAGLQRHEAADAHLAQGNAYRDQGRLDEAIASYRSAVAGAPDFAAAHVNLGGALAQRGMHPEAIASFRKALALEPELPEALFNLGASAYQLRDLASAKAALGAYLRKLPGDRNAALLLGEVHFTSNELDEAAACVERVLAAEPRAGSAHNLLANIYRNQGRHELALRHYELAIRHDPNPVVAFQNLLFMMMCAAGVSAAEIHARHREFARRFEQPLLAARPVFQNAPDPARRLKIGYVSPEFRYNVVGHYMQPILEHHDRSQFESHAYSTGPVHDQVSERISRLAGHWHDARALSDDALAALVRSHQIDILVDLCGHGPGSRLLAFARRPAPVQVNYLDYSATTGLSSIDYRLTTEYADPRGRSEQYYSEKLWRLPDAYWTYNPLLALPVTDLPMKANGYATFGSFNLYYRITSGVLDLWLRLLRAIPRSRLLIASVAPGSTHAALGERIDRAGIARERVSIHGVVPLQQYHELMGTVDIALAPFPYNGATTAMDCLWNGLPVVAKAGGETFTTRLGCNVLHLMGLDAWIAADEDEYIRIAASLAANASRLAELRRTLRRKLERSPLRDFHAFTRELEAAYRAMWQDWCETRCKT